MQQNPTVNVKIYADGTVAVTQINGVRVGINALSNDMLSASGAAKNLTNAMGGFNDTIKDAIKMYLGFKSIVAANDAWMQFDTATQSAANLTGAALTEIKDKATATGIAMGRFAGDVAGSFGVIGSKMPDLLKMPSAMDAVTRSSIQLAQAAKATGDKMTDTEGAEAIASVLNQWTVAANDASYQSERVANVLAASAQLGSASITKVVASLRDSGTVASDASVSIESYNAMIQTLASRQIEGSHAGIALRNTLTMLMTKGSEFKEFGISADSVNPKIVGIQTALENLKPMLANDIAMTKIFGAENIVAAKILGSSADKIKELTASLTGTKTAQEQAAASVKMFSVQTDMLSANLKNIASLTIDNLVGPSLAPSLATINAGLSYLAANSKTVAATVGVAAEVLGVGGALYLGIAAMPIVMTAATAASTAFGMGVLAFSANAGAGASVLTILNTNLYGTGVAAQFAASGMGKLQVAGGLVFAAFAGWEIGTYLYNNFEVARVAGEAFVKTALIGFENIKMYAALGGGAIATGFLLPFSLVRQAFDEMIGLIAAKFAGLTGAIASSSLVPASVAKGFKEIQTSLNNVAIDSAQASTQQLGLITKIRDGVTSVVDESKKEIATINAVTDSTTAYSLATNTAVAAQKTLTNAVDETAKKAKEVAEAHALQFGAIAKELQQYQDFSAKSKERFDAEKKVYDLLKERKFVGTDAEKEQLVAIEMTTAARKKQGEIVYQAVEQLKKEADSLGGVTEAQKQLNLLQANNASPAIIEQVKNYQKLIDLGKNTDLIGKKQIENRLFSEGANLVGIEGERFKATLELQRNSLDRNSEAFRAQIKLIGDMAEQHIRLQAVQKTAETVAELTKETAAYQASAAAVELYNAKKSLGVGATDAQAQQVVQAQLLDAQAKQLRATQDNLDLSKLSVVAQEVETQRRQLGATATAEMAAQYVALNKQLAANNALHDAQKSVIAADLTTQAKQYLDIMQQVGVEDGKRVIALQNQAKLTSVGTDRIQSLQQEIALLKLSADDQARYNALRDVAPDQRPAVLALQNQKIELDKIQQSWKNTTDSAVNYLEKIATGEMSLKDALKGFVIDFNKQQIKDQLDKLKQMFSSNPVSLEGALSISDSQVSKDVQAAEAVFSKYRDAVATGTDAATDKLVTGIKDSLQILQTGLNDSVGKLTAAVQSSVQQAAQSTQTVAQNITSNVAKITVSGTGKEASIDALKQAADKYGIKQDDLLKIAKVESNFNASAQNKTSSAGGLGQFIDSTWAKYGNGGSKYDPAAGADALARYYQDNIKALESFPRALQDVAKQLPQVLVAYGEHQQGSAGFKSLLSAASGAGFTRSDTRANVISNTVGVSRTELSSMGDQQLAQTWIKQWQTKFDSLDMSKLVDATSKAGTAIDNHAAIVTQATATQAAHTDTTANSTQANAANAAATVNAAKGAWTFADTATGAAGQIKAIGFNAAAGDKLVNTSGGLPWAQAAAGEASGGGLLNSLGLGDIGGSISGVVGDIKSSVTGFLSPATDLLKGFGDSGLGMVKSAMSLFSGDTKGAIGGLISTGLSAALPGVGTALSLAVTPLINSMFGSWKVESQHLTANIQDLKSTFQVQTIETKKSFGSTEHKTTYSAVSDSQNKELQAAQDAVIKQMKDVGSKIGTALTDSFKFSYVIDMVHQDTGDFKTQFARAQSTMLKNAFMEANIAGVDTSVASVMSAKISNTYKSAADGVFSKAFQAEMWKPGTQELAQKIQTTAKDSLMQSISSTKWDGLSFDQMQTTLVDKVNKSFADIGMSVNADDVQKMATQFVQQIQDGIDFIGKNAINPDAQFFKNAKEIVGALDQWNMKPEEVKAYIDQVLGLGDAFKLAELDANQISKSLIDKAGSIGELSSGVANFAKGFLSQTEQDQARLSLATKQTSQVFAELGVKIPATRDQFKALVQGVSSDLSNPANQQKFAELVKISDKMAEVYSLQSKLGQTAIDVFGIVQNQLDGLANSISANDIGKMLTDSISKASDANDAGKRFSEAFADSFRQQMLNTVINSVAQMVLQGIVQPMLTSAAQSASMTAQGGAVAASGMASGASVAGTNLAVGGSSAGTAVATGGIVAGNGLSAVVGKIKDFLEISAKVMKSDEIKSLLADVMPGMADIGSTTYTAVTSPTSITAPLYTPQVAVSADKGGSGGSSTENQAEKDAQTLSDAYKKWHQSMLDAQSGLDGNDLALNRLAETYKKANLSGLQLVGTSQDVAKSLDTLSPEKLREIALAAGVTVDTLVSDGASYINILKEQEKAQLALNDSFDKFSEKGDKTTQLITRFATAANDAGLGTDGAISLLKSLSDAEWKKYATEYGVSIETLKNTVSTGTLQGIQDFNAWKKSLNDFIEPSKTAKKVTDALTTSVFNAGIGSADAAKWVQSLTDSDISKYAKQLGLTDKQLRDLVPSVLTSLDELNNGFKEWRDGLNQYTSSGSKITQVTKQLSDLGVSANVSTDALVGWVQSVTPAEMQAYADSLGIPVDKLKTDVIPSVLGGLQTLNNGLKDWQTSLMQYTDVGTRSSQVTKQLVQAAAGYTNNDIVGWLSKLSVADMERYAKELGLTSEQLKTAANDVFGARKAIDDFNQSMRDTSVTAGKSKYTGKLSGMDLDLSGVDIWRTEQVKKAKDLGADLTDVEAAYGRKREEVLRKYGQAALDGLIETYNKLSDNLAALKGKAGDDIAALRQAINPVSATDYRKQLGGQLTAALDFKDSDAVQKRIDLGDKYRQAIADEVKAEETKINAAKDAAKSVYDTAKKAWDDAQSAAKDKFKAINSAMDAVATAILDVKGQTVKNTKLQKAFDGGDISVANDLIGTIKDGLKTDLDAIKTRRDAAQKAIDDEINSLKDLQKNAVSLHDSIKQDRDSLTAEIAKASGNTTYWQQQADALRGQIAGALDPKSKLDLLSKARDVEKSALQERIDNQKTLQQVTKDFYQQQIDFAKQLKDYGNSLMLSAESPLTNSQRYDTAKQQLQDVVAQARAGNKDAEGKVQGAMDAFLKESTNMYSSGDPHTADFGYVQGLVKELGLNATVQAEQAKANIPLDDTAFAKSITEIQQGSLARLDSLDALISTTQTELQAKIDGTKIDDSVFSKDTAAANAAAQVQLESIATTLQAQLALSNQQLATPAPVEINQAQYVDQLNSARQNAIDLLTGLQGTIDSGQQLLTNSFAGQIIDLGNTFGLSQAQTTAAVQDMGGNLGSRLDMVVATLNGGLAQVAGSVGAAYTAVQADVKAAQATANAAVAAAQAKPATAIPQGSMLDIAIALAKAQNSGDKTAIATAQTSWDVLSNSRLAQAANDAPNLGMSADAARRQVQDSLSQATAAASWQAKLPSYEVGTLEVPEDQLSNLHQGEMVMPADTSKIIRAFLRDGGSSGGDNSSALAALIEKLIAENKASREEIKQLKDVLLAILDAQEEQIYATREGSDGVRRTLENTSRKVKQA